jgi:ribonucleoside-diphosphate reductase beta chain
VSLIPDAITPHEEAVYTNIAFMESVHAKSYSSIFSTLASTPEIDDAFRWSVENPNLQKKAHIVMDYYRGDDPSSARSPRPCSSRSCSTRASTCRCTGRARRSSRTRPTSSASSSATRPCTATTSATSSRRVSSSSRRRRRDELKDYTFSLLYELYDNEVQYTQDLYDGIGLTEDVKKFLHYNANKALMNLGYEAMFPSTVTNVNPAILSALSPNADENHDFFSGSGSSYVIGKAVATEDDDWD